MLTFKLAQIAQIEKASSAANRYKLDMEFRAILNILVCYQNVLEVLVSGVLKDELLLLCPQDLVHTREIMREAVNIYKVEQLHQIQNPRCGTSGIQSEEMPDENV